MSIENCHRTFFASSLAIVLLASSAHAEDMTDAAARASPVEVVERPAPPRKLLVGKHMRNPALFVTGIVLSTGGTVAIIASAAETAAGDVGWEAMLPFVIQTSAIAIGSGITMAILGAWPVAY